MDPTTRVTTQSLLLPTSPTTTLNKCLHLQQQSPQTCRALESCTLSHSQPSPSQLLTTIPRQCKPRQRCALGVFFLFTASVILKPQDVKEGSMIQQWLSLKHSTYYPLGFENTHFVPRAFPRAQPSSTRAGESCFLGRLWGVLWKYQAHCSKQQKHSKRQ